MTTTGYCLAFLAVGILAGLGFLGAMALVGGFLDQLRRS